MQQYFDLSGTVEGDAKRQQVKEALRVLDVEFCAHGVELGWFHDLDYDAEYGAHKRRDRNPQVNKDGEMELYVCRPNTCQGSQLPHAWLVNSKSHQRKSTRELLQADKLLLIASSASWGDLHQRFVATLIVSDGDEDG